MRRKGGTGEFSVKKRVTILRATPQRAAAALALAVAAAQAHSPGAGDGARRRLRLRSFGFGHCFVQFVSVWFSSGSVLP